MRRPESPDEIRRRLKALDRLAEAAGADPDGALGAGDVQRMFALMAAARRAAESRAR